MTRLALATDEFADAIDLLGHALIGCNDVIESIRDLAEEAVFLAGEPGAELSSSDLPARFFGTPLAIFLLVTVVGCIDASRITRLHRHACARRGRSEAIRSELHGQRPINAKLPCHGCSPFIWDRTLTPSRSLQTLVTLERPPAIKSANPGKVPFRRCDIRSKAGSPGHAATALSRHHRYG
jgi:hypothetical protein